MNKELIFLKGEVTYSEYKATGAISAGHLLVINANGVAVNPTAKADTPAIFANRNYLVGKTVSDAYAQNDQVLTGACTKGCEVNALIAPNAPAIVKGDFLEASTGGHLQKFTNGKRLAVALEGIDNSTSGTASLSLIMIL